MSEHCSRGTDGAHTDEQENIKSEQNCTGKWRIM